MQGTSVITLETLDRPDSISINGIEPVDIWTVLGPLIGVPMLLSLFGAPSIVALVSGAFGGVAGVLFVYAAPSYLNVVETAKVWGYYLKQPSSVTQFEDAALKTNDNLIKTIEADKTTEEFLSLNRYYPEQNVVKRSDGTYIALIELMPPNLDFSSGEVMNVAEKIGDYYNEQVDFDTSLFITTEPFDIEGYLNNLQARRRSNDVQDKAIMKALLDEQINVRPNQLEQTGTQVTRFYLVIETKQTTINTSTVEDKTPVERLADIPLLGIFAEIFINVSDDTTELEQHGESLQKLAKRKDRLQRGLTQGLDGWDTRDVSLTEWLLFLQRMNKGRNVGGTPGIRTQPIQTTPIDNDDQPDSGNSEADENGSDSVTDDGESPEITSQETDPESDNETESTEPESSLMADADSETLTADEATADEATEGELESAFLSDDDDVEDSDEVENEPAETPEGGDGK